MSGSAGGVSGLIFAGLDWAEAHHDVHVEDELGRRLAAGRLPDGIEGIARFHDLVAVHAEAPGEVVVGIETDRGLFAAALIAAGYQVFAVNPMSVSRYRDRHASSGAKSDPGDAKVLADLVRTDRHNHRPAVPDSDLAEAVKVLARAHQSMIWNRRGSQPAPLGAAGVLSRCPDRVRRRPDQRRRDRGAESGTRAAAGRGPVERPRSPLLRRGGRTRRIGERAAAVQAALRAPQLQPAPLVAAAMGASVAALVAVTGEMTRQISALEQQLTADFEQHPDAVVVRSLPGLGTILGARVLGEFGDKPDRYLDVKSRRNYAGTSPITRASGKKRVVLARHVRNKRLGDAIYLWAFSAISASPGARAYYDHRRAAGDNHNQALRALGNHLVGFLHGCLARHALYDEHTAWAHRTSDELNTAA